MSTMRLADVPQPVSHIPRNRKQVIPHKPKDTRRPVDVVRKLNRPSGKVGKPIHLTALQIRLARISCLTRTERLRSLKLKRFQALWVTIAVATSCINDERLFKVTTGNGVDPNLSETRLHAGLQCSRLNEDLQGYAGFGSEGVQLDAE